ncbi:hypothetical protein [Pantoea sp. ME81]|uniref:hypothetical protein n=1 Tax=Pantoea sp. ME81 TaxID=2743935 RepID=UPI0015F3E205|nr:hypothetical protein [Pantoea sp. ME81]
MTGRADNPNGELMSYITGADTLIRAAERHYTSSSHGEPVTVIHIEVREESE